jgi:antitoxin (DNA-binding transcriptional repressor) of toxin-antitoxin stability system
MPTFNVYEAKTQLSKLLDMASEGTEVIIARAGRPMQHLENLTLMHMR